MIKHNILFGALALGAVWAQPSLAVASYDLDGLFSFSTTTSVNDQQLAEGITFFDPAIALEGNGTGRATPTPGENDIFLDIAATGSAGPDPLPDFSASELSGEILVDTETLFAEFGLLTVDFGITLSASITVTDPAFSSASAGYEVLVFGEDLLVSSVQGLVDESDLVNGSASVSVNESLGPLSVNDGFDFYIVQYTVFGDAVSVEVPEPGVAWLATAGLLMVGASRIRRS